MAKDKLTWLDLRKSVAEYANTSEQEAGQFLNALLDGVLEGLKSDKQVKIKGLGSFSLKPVSPRKSVNIATGESFTIEGYNKLNFSAESMLKESVEKRLENPKTEAIMAELNNDPIKKLGEQADEIIDILTELGQTPTSTKISTPDLLIDTNNPKVDTNSTVKLDANTTTQESTENSATTTQDKIEIPTNTSESTTYTQIPKATYKCKCHYTPWVIIALLLTMIIGAGIYFRETLIQWWQCMEDCQPSVEEVIDTKEVIDNQIIPLADQPREYVNFIGIERVGENSRLAWISYKYYAQKDLWVFIYEANRDIISHPSHVRPGQYIRIPDLNEKYRNLYNPELKQLVDSLAIEYLKK